MDRLGDKDNLITGSWNLHQALVDAKIDHVWYVDSGVHEFPVWNNNLYLFAQMLFKPAGSVTPPPSIGNYTGGPTGGAQGGMPGMGRMMGGRGGLSQELRQKINDAVPADLQTKLQDAQKAAVAAALAENATAASVKAKVDAVIKIQAEIAMPRYGKGLKLNMKDLTDEQKTQLNEMGAGAYNQLFAGGSGFGMGGFGMPRAGRGAAPAVN